MDKKFKIFKIHSIRDGVFETNSSSNHSLIIGDEFTPMTLQEELDEFNKDNNYFKEVSLNTEDVYLPIITGSDFGQSGQLSNNTFFKLTYILSSINLSVLDEKFKLREIIKRHIPNFKGFDFVHFYDEFEDDESTIISKSFKTYNIGHVDHQSQDMVEYVISAGFENLDEIIFNRQYYLHIGSDGYRFDDEYTLPYSKRYSASNTPYIEAEYENGNYIVKLYSDGSKFRITEGDIKLDPEFPESIDLKISNHCPYNCAFCHERSTIKDNENGFADELLDFVKTLNPGTEVALGGGAITTIPVDRFRDLIKALRTKDIIINITLNWREMIIFREFQQAINSENNFWWFPSAIGVSISDIPKDRIPDLAEAVRGYSNIVFHAIAGLVDTEILYDIANSLADTYTYPNLLILGFKNFGRGKNVYLDGFESIAKKQLELKNELPELRKKFHRVSFDTLGLEQLDIKNMISDVEWKLFYLGGDGETTMYVDGTNMTYGVNSIAEDRFTIEAGETINDIFKKVREHVANNRR